MANKHETKGNGFTCTKCGSEVKVIDSRNTDFDMEIRRRRECLNPTCKHRYHTIEKMEADLDFYELEPFDGA